MVFPLGFTYRNKTLSPDEDCLSLIVHPASLNLSKSRPILDFTPEPLASLPLTAIPFGCFLFFVRGITKLFTFLHDLSFEYILQSLTRSLARFESISVVCLSRAVDRGLLRCRCYAAASWLALIGFAGKIAPRKR